LASPYSFADKLTFKDTGFEINALQAPPHGNGSQPLTMLLPSEHGFSANVNVQVQMFENSLLEYQTLSEMQFKQMDIEVISATIENGVLQYEYKGFYEQKNLHWYAKAIKSGAYVYLATATSLEVNWLQNKFELQQAVDSFKLTK
jgi:hypothetical protein